MNLFSIKVIIGFDPEAAALLKRLLDMYDQTQAMNALAAEVAAKSTAVRTALEGAGAPPQP